MLDGRAEDRGIEPLRLLPAVQRLASVPIFALFVTPRTIAGILSCYVPEIGRGLHTYIIQGS